MKTRLALILTLAIVATVVSATAHALSDTAQAQHLRLRYCQRSALGSAYTTATPNVSCATAKAVVHHIPGRSCLSREQCDVLPFVCVSYYSEFGFSKPFIDSHHGLCVASRGRRIEFDLG